MKTKTVICKECGEPFNAELRETRRGNAKFCSRSCSMKYINAHRKFHELKCHFDQCQKQYKSKNSNSLYCSDQCSRKARNLRSTGSIRNGRNKLKRAVIAITGETGFQCFICGWHEDSCDIHHIVPRNKGGTNDLSNLSVLCPNHHRLADRKKLKDPPSVFSRYRTISSSPGGELDAQAGN